MKIGFIGLGRMGGNMVLRLLKDKKEVVVYNKEHDKIKELTKHGAIGTYSIDEFAKKLGKEKIIWLMIPHEAVDEVIKEVLPHMNKGDILIDGGNSNFNQTIKRGNEIEKNGIRFIDIGVSGGTAAAKIG